MEIRPDTQKNFIIARVTLSKKNLIGKKILPLDPTIVAPIGYSLFWTTNNLTSLEQKTRPATTIKNMVENGTKGGATEWDVVTIYWRRDDLKDYKIVVPWGIASPSGGEGYNGQVGFGLDIEQFMSTCMYVCEMEAKDGLNYEYLSEYYVNEKNEPKGLSVAIRELLVPELEGCKSEEEITKKIKEFALGLKKYGLIWDKSRIVVNEFGHRPVEGGGK